MPPGGQGAARGDAALAAATAVRPPAALKDTTLRPPARPGRCQPAPAAWPGPRRRRCLVLGLAAAGGRRRGGGRRGGGRVRVRHAAPGSNQAQQHDHAVATVLSAPDATMLTGPVRTGGTATVVMSAPGAGPGVHRRRPPGAAVGPALRALAHGPVGDRPAGMVTASPHGGMAGPMVHIGAPGRGQRGPHRGAGLGLTPADRPAGPDDQPRLSFQGAVPVGANAQVH